MCIQTAAIALLLGGCAKKASEPTMSPDAEAAGASEIDALEAQLAVHEDQLQVLGAAAPGASTRAAKKEAADDLAGADEAAPTMADAESERRPSQPAPTDRCIKVCDLSTTICGLEHQICGLAPRHPDEPRYQRACDRAAVDCSFATEACHACS